MIFWRKDSTTWAEDTRHAARLSVVIFALMMALFVLPVTRLVFNPQNVSIDGDQVTLHRTFPGDEIGLPRPYIRYVETVQPLSLGWNNGRFCQDRLSDATQYNSPHAVGIWNIPWAHGCLSDPVGFVWSARWYAYAGRLPLGPVSLSQTFFKREGMMP